MKEVGTWSYKKAQLSWFLGGGLSQPSLGWPFTERILLKNPAENLKSYFSAGLIIWIERSDNSQNHLHRKHKHGQERAEEEEEKIRDHVFQQREADRSAQPVSATLPNSAEQGLLSLAKLDRVERRFFLSTLNEIRQRPMMQEQMDKNWPQTELGSKLEEF